MKLLSLSSLNYEQAKPTFPSDGLILMDGVFHLLLKISFWLKTNLSRSQLEVIVDQW